MHLAEHLDAVERKFLLDLARQTLAGLGMHIRNKTAVVEGEQLPGIVCEAQFLQRAVTGTAQFKACQYALRAIGAARSWASNCS